MLVWLELPAVATQSAPAASTAAPAPAAAANSFFSPFGSPTPVATTPQTQQNGAFGFQAFNMGTVPAKTAKPKLDNGRFLDPSFNDCYNEHGCLYYPTRGEKRFIFCGKQRMQGYPCCSECSKRATVNDLLTKCREPGFTPASYREYVRQKRIAAGSKTTKSAATPLPAGSFMMPNFGTQPQAASAFSFPFGSTAPQAAPAAPAAQPQPEIQMKRYKHDPNSGYLWIVGPGYVIKQSQDPKQSIYGISSSPDEPFRQLTPQEKAAAENTGFFTVDPSAVSGGSAAPIAPAPSPFGAVGGPAPAPSPFGDVGAPLPTPSPLSNVALFGSSTPAPAPSPFGDVASSLPEPSPFGLPSPLPLPDFAQVSQPQSTIVDIIQ
jgi:hypothetical protein